jgi:tetratricopeptide (TPR) repeat protein
MNEKVIDILKIRGLAGLLIACVAIAPSKAAPDIETISGAYLAGRHAQEKRDYAAAATWYEDALRADPESPELISRTFVMEASEGRFDRARLLAEKTLKLDPTDALAELILLIERIKAGDKAGAL